MSRIVNNDYSPMIAQFGDVVKTRKVTKFVANRKDPTDNVTVQDAQATSYQVALNQWPHVSFQLNDSEITKSFKDLVSEFLEPAMMALAKMIDQCLLYQFAQFLPNGVGRLGNMTTSTVKTDILSARKAMNDLLVPDVNRVLMWTSNGESKALATDLFIASNQRGDGGDALTNATLGRILGFNNYMSQNAPTVTATTRVTGTVNAAGGYSVGATTFTVTGFSAAIAAGSFITVAGDDTPLRVVSTVGAGTPTSITVSSGLKQAVANSAVVTVYTPGTVTGAYALGYSKAITISAAIMPSVGQMVTFKQNTTGAVYVVTQKSGSTIVLDRPLEEALSNSDAINLGPAGDYNFAFDRDAIMMVSRPLATALPGTGVAMSVANNENIALRASISYNGLAQAHLITIDTLFGVAIRDASRGVPLFG